MEQIRPQLYPLDRIPRIVSPGVAGIPGERVGVVVKSAVHLAKPLSSERSVGPEEIRRAADQ